MGQKIWPSTCVEMIPLGFEETSLSVSKLAVCQSIFYDVVSVGICVFTGKVYATASRLISGF